MIFYFYKNKQKGYIALVSVILVSVIGIAISVSLVLLSLAHSQNSFVSEQATQANVLAESCVEVALLNLQQDQNYSGNETVTVGADNCQVEPITVNGSVYTVNTQAQVGSVVKKIFVQAELTSGTPVSILIDSWKSVADF